MMTDCPYKCPPSGRQTTVGVEPAIPCKIRSLWHTAAVIRPPHFLLPLLTPVVGSLGLYLQGAPAPLAATVETAFDSLSRKRGLLGRASVPADYALVIAPCNLVHTFTMTFDIDVIFAARDGRIVKLRPGLRPGRVSGAIGAFAAIEMSPGSIERAGLAVGQRLEVRSKP